MRTLELEKMNTINGGEGFVGGLCSGIAIGSGVYAVGLFTNWWNPVGWLSAAFVVADVACAAYALSD